ncbi:MAG TPA: ABC transporter ATP-binding protein [Oscillospiraceae bacterium]|nr:ABC transporter ATP-binding protein [Oscillospiraceae bacterium]
MNEKTAAPAVCVQNIGKAYGSVSSRAEALKNISFEVQAGEFVSIMGPSGCGKSTLLYIIGGLEKQDEGRVLLSGTDLRGMNDRQKSEYRRRNIGFVFQFYNLVQDLTVEENILLPILMDGGKARDNQEKLDRLLDLIGLSDKKKSIPRELSGGQQQRVSIARAVIASPKLVLADEPTGNLDRASGTEVLELFGRLNRESGVTILQVTHSPYAAHFSTRTLLMRDGRMEEKAEIFQSEEMEL